MGNNKKSSSVEGRRINVAIAVMSVLGIFILCDLAFLGNTVFYIKWVECGHKPIILHDPNPFDAASNRSYIDPPTVSLRRGYPRYVCSADS